MGSHYHVGFPWIPSNLKTCSWHDPIMILDCPNHPVGPLENFHRKAPAFEMGTSMWGFLWLKILTKENSPIIPSHPMDFWDPIWIPFWESDPILTKFLAHILCYSQLPSYIFPPVPKPPSPESRVQAGFGAGHRPGDARGGRQRGRLSRDVGPGLGGATDLVGNATGRCGNGVRKDGEFFFFRRVMEVPPKCWV